MPQAKTTGRENTDHEHAGPEAVCAQDIVNGERVKRGTTLARTKFVTSSAAHPERKAERAELGRGQPGVRDAEVSETFGTL